MRHSACRSLLAGALLASVASAQIITWGPVSNSTSPSDVSISGSPVFAANAHHTTLPAINATVNGVTFTGGFAPVNWNGWIDSGLNGSTTGDAEFDKLLANSLAMQTAPPTNPTVWGGIWRNSRKRRAGHGCRERCWRWGWPV